MSEFASLLSLVELNLERSTIFEFSQGVAEDSIRPIRTDRIKLIRKSNSVALPWKLLIFEVRLLSDGTPLFGPDDLYCVLAGRVELSLGLPQPEIDGIGSARGRLPER